MICNKCQESDRFYQGYIVRESGGYYCVYMLRRFSLAIWLSTCFALVIPFSAVAALSNDEQVAISKQIQIISDAVNSGDPAPIRDIISPNSRSELLSDLEERLSGKPIEFMQSISSYKEISPNMVRVRLCSPAVKTSKSTSIFFSKR